MLKFQKTKGEVEIVVEEEEAVMMIEEVEDEMIKEAEGDVLIQDTVPEIEVSAEAILMHHVQDVLISIQVRVFRVRQDQGEADDNKIVNF